MIVVFVKKEQCNFFFRTKTEFKREEIPGDKLFRKPHSNAFIDVDNDFTAGKLKYYLKHPHSP